MKVSNDSGVTWNFNYGTAVGDIGNNVTTGTNKTITWSYSGAFSNKFQIKIVANDLAIDGGPCEITSVSYSGGTYNTVQIALQCWLKENINAGKMLDSTLDQLNDTVIQKYCYSGDEGNCSQYGGLYQWGEAMQYSMVEGAQGICPDGWHIPTYADFLELKASVGNDANSLKAIGQGLLGGIGTNTSGFSAMLGGSMFPPEFHAATSYNSLGGWGQFWSSTGTNPYYLNLGSIYSDLALPQLNPPYGISVRCIQN